MEWMFIVTQSHHFVVYKSLFIPHTFHLYTHAHTHTQSQAQSKEPKLSTPVEPSAPDPSSVEDKPDDIAARLKTLLEEKTALEIELTSLKAASGTEVREKAELIVSEKKHRAQVVAIVSFCIIHLVKCLTAL